MSDTERERLDCTVDDVDEKGVGRCMCSLVTAAGGACRMWPTSTKATR